MDKESGDKEKQNMMIKARKKKRSENGKRRGKIGR